MKKTVMSFLVIVVSVSLSCSQKTDATVVGNPGESGGNTTGVWSIPVKDILDGGPGKDGIPALENPLMISSQEATYLSEDDLVIGYKKGDDVRAYSHIVLDWHEIINDNIGNVSLALTYCPLTGTGIGWNRIVKGKETTFGVSGLLYNTNLIPYDRETGSNWSQILNEAVNGELIGEKAALIPLVEMQWGAWKAMYPNSKVVSTSTGHSRDYGISPYGNYAEEHDFFLFPVEKDARLNSKERVLTLVSGKQAKVYRFPSFEAVKIIYDDFLGEQYMVVGNESFMVAFKIEAEHNLLEFEYVYNGTAAVLLTDDEGNEWDVFGEALSGPRKGQKLGAAPYFMAYWFSIPAFYTTVIYTGN
ncbi:DUF3179 domain-containing protein [Cellulophaga sp. F20128]|uniref:DUF3179 domain-containing protein n=1 Tax=Cellulophaga sp. F20128 TaxID=2926413 RepID=UPI001FF6CBE9|nr:DUF3179 domain-containing protein [Cellulophaga sp. F20128]MCK0157334.1 DUF3179 domain-containing protein [Cellulophaga sp. F20128]